jgi:hypothetical protein
MLFLEIPDCFPIIVHTSHGVFGQQVSSETPDEHRPRGFRHNVVFVVIAILVLDAFVIQAEVF